MTAVGTRYQQDGQHYTAWLFRSESEARAFVMEMMEDPTANVAAGLAELDSGAWRVVLGQHFDA